MRVSTTSIVHPAASLLALALLGVPAAATAQAREGADRADPAWYAGWAARELRVPLERLTNDFERIQAELQAQRREAEAQGRDGERPARWEAQYEAARRAIERAQWSQAVQQFTALAQARAPRADAAMYWRAYALDKMNQHADALAAVSDLLKTFPASRWMGDARALELQVRQRVGQSVPVDTGDDELKLLAIQGLQQTAPERAVPLLMKVINDVGSVRLKERALFVLAQSSTPEARATLEKVARGSANPELQVKAVQYIAMSGRPEKVTLLDSLYASASDVEMKRQVLRAFAMGGDRQRVLTAALTEKAPELRTEAVRQLGMLGARAELWQLYQKESAVDVKRGILTALARAGAVQRLGEVVATEKDPQLRAVAVRQFGMAGGRGAGDTLVPLYAKESDVQVRRAIIDALGYQNNAEVLVSLARKETNPELRRELVRRLSFMRSPAAVEYLTEILNK